MARKTKAEAQLTRSRILDAAEQLFEARGVSRSSLQDIANAAGVTRGAIYWHFQDKGALFNAMMERVRLPLEEAASGLELEPDGGRAPLERLRCLLLATLAHVTGDAQVRRVFEIATHKVEYIDELAAVRQRHLLAVQAHCATIERALLRAGCSPEIARGQALGLHALVAGLIHTWMLDATAFDLVATGRLAIDTHLQGITPTLTRLQDAGARALCPRRRA